MTQIPLQEQMRLEDEQRRRDFIKDARWLMDAATGIPYPDFHPRNALENELAFHDLQEPVTAVTHDERILFAIFRCQACGVELRQPRSRALDHDDMPWALKIIVDNCKRISMPHECKIGQVGAMEFVMAIIDDGTPDEVAELERSERYQAERYCR